MYLVQATVNYSRFVTEINYTTTLVQPWRNSIDSPTTTLAWLRIRNTVQFQTVVLTLYLPLYSSRMNVFKSGRMMGESNSSDLVEFVDFIWI